MTRTDSAFSSTASRRTILMGATGVATTAALGMPVLFGASRDLAAQTSSTKSQKGQTMGTITTRDGTQIYYKDWGQGQPVVFSHGWPLTADAWEDQMFFLARSGYRVIGHDRRGHGRSGQTWGGNDLDT